jgi:hypothetical protein
LSINTAATLIPDEITQSPVTKTSEHTTLLLTPKPHRRIRVELPKNITKTDPEYYDDITPRPFRPHLSQSGIEDVDVTFNSNIEEEPLVQTQSEPGKTTELKHHSGDKNRIKSVPNLTSLVKLLRHGKSDSTELDDIVGQVIHILLIDLYVWNDFVSG